MKEVKLYTVALLGLMVLAYLSWTKKDEVEQSSTVTLLSAAPERVEQIEFFTKTSTVKVSFRKHEGERYSWFEVQGSRSTRVFVGSDKVEGLVKDFAPFEALRSLGKDLSEEELKLTGLNAPKQKLVLKVLGQDKTFDVGDRTGGARDFYVRPKSAEAVFLVASRILSDLQFPEGKFMQRQLRTAPRTEVNRVTLSVKELSLTALQKNRLSTQDAFWATEAAPDTKNEALGNYLEKLEKLTAVEYLQDAKVFEAATPVLEAVWYSEGGDELGRVDLRKVVGDKEPTYYAVSTATYVPVKVSRYTAESLEKDAASALGSP